MEWSEFDWDWEWATGTYQCCQWNGQSAIEDMSAFVFDGHEFLQNNGTAISDGQSTDYLVHHQELELSFNPISTTAGLSSKDSPHQGEDVYGTCRHCDAGFGSLPELEAHAHETSHASFACAECSVRFGKMVEFETHQLTTGHVTFNCDLEVWYGRHKCIERYRSLSMLFQHQIDPGHYRHHRRTVNCEQCRGLFPSSAHLTRHAIDENHGAHKCSVEGCHSSFTREADKLRHETQHSTDEHPKHPCPHCHRHRGVKGFKRKDHLTQHLRNYHNIEPEKNTSGMVYACSHRDCPEHRLPDEKYVNGTKSEGHGYPFKTKAERTKHLKEDHDESQFPCPIPYCDKVGGQGYMRKSDLVKHINAKHPKAPANQQLQLQAMPEVAVWNAGTPAYETSIWQAQAPFNG